MFQASTLAQAPAGIRRRALPVLEFQAYVARGLVLARRVAGFAPSCAAHCPMHRAVVRQAESMLSETLVSPPALHRAAHKGGSFLLPLLAGEGPDRS